MLPETFFATAKRSDLAEIAAQAELLAKNPAVLDFADGVPEWILVLNENRQIVFANLPVRMFAEGAELASCLGFRPGELLGCRHAETAPSGCGTGKACQDCGAVNSILCALTGKKNTKECTITTIHDSTMELRVMVRPFQSESGNFVLMMAQDIAAEKRKNAIEHIFLHDLLNSASSLVGLSELISMEPAEAGDLAKDLLQVSGSLVEEIRSHRLLLSAEAGNIHPIFSQINAKTILEEVSRVCEWLPCSTKKTVKLSCEENISFSSDPTALRRVLINLLKNALEAVRPGDSVELGCRSGDNETVVFWCKNKGVIPREISLRIFERNNTSKGEGRGLGTHGVHLLTERFLGGSASFRSSEEEGTVFEISLPSEQKIEVF